MKKILYFMGVDWYWIKQRPQILAEYLAQDYDVTVVYIKELFQKQSLRQDKDELEKSIGIPVIPYRDKNAGAYRVQKALFHKVIKHVNEYDTIWIGHPLLYRYIPRSYNGRVIYDCMDNHEALCKDAKIRKMIHQTEMRLIQRADLIFASSEGLAEKMIKKGGKEKCRVVRNGVILKEVHEPQSLLQRTEGRYKIGYFGTIAEWFDFPLLIKSLQENPDIEYHLWGPVAISPVPQRDRIFYEGVMEHHCLWEGVKDMDCLIMPFQVNDIIRDVDPVKLYEYISMGKPILSVYYKEVNYFREFVFFYHSPGEFVQMIRQLAKGDLKLRYSSENQRIFLEKNSWKMRYDDIKKYIENNERG